MREPGVRGWLYSQPPIVPFKPSLPLCIDSVPERLGDGRQAILGKNEELLSAGTDEVYRPGKPEEHDLANRDVALLVVSWHID